MEVEVCEKTWCRTRGERLCPKELHGGFPSWKRCRVGKGRAQGSYRMIEGAAEYVRQM